MTSVCKSCSADLPYAALVCARCHTLVHGAALEQIAASARMLEEQREFKGAGEQWLKALPLLPEDSKQAAWIQEHAGRLDVVANTSVPIVPGRRKWPKWLAPLAPVLVVLSKGKALVALFNAKFLISFGAFLGVYWSLFGMAFALGLVLQILVHEMGHYIDIRRRGLPADMPLFLPGVGAFVRWNALGVSLETRAAVSLAGPLAGCFAAAACALLWMTTQQPLWAALARSGAWLNLLNLIPVLGLDGSHAFSALSQRQRGVLIASALLLFAFVGDGVLLLVVLGAAWRMFTKDFPDQPSVFATMYFVAVLCALSGLIWFVPGHGFGQP